jgi:Tfp pilus assembly protein FimV
VKIRSRISCLTACLCAVPLAHALGMGGISGSGGRGYPLDAYITLYAAPSERQTITGVELLPEITLDAAADRALLSRITASIEHTPDGSFVHLASTLPLAVDRISFRLRVITTRGALFSHYDLRLADMRPALASMPSQAPTRDIVARPRGTPAILPAKSIGDGGSYGPVRSGDSLWLIAKRLGAGGNIQEMMNALHALNPHAFVGGDMSRLRVGVMLQTPRGSSLPGAAPSSTPTGTEEPATAGREEEVAPVRPAAPVAALVREPRADGSRPAPAIVRQRRIRDPALVARLAELDAKFAAIRARYGQSAPATAASAAVTLDAVELATTAARALDTTPVTAVADPSPAAPAPLAAAAAARAVEAVPAAATLAPTPTTSDRRGQSTPDAGWGRVLGWVPYGALGLVLLVAIAWAVLRLSSRLGQRRAQTSFENHRAADVDRKAEVARKAENRVRMETEIKGLLDRKGAATGVSLATSVQPHATTALPPLGAADGPESRASEMNDASRDIAIDTSIAHGRYAEAETLLREDLRANPRSVQSKLRLAELYYITEQVECFAQLAAEMKEQDRANLSDEEWKRVVRMGKILAPEMMPFSGPRMVGLRA